MIHLGDVVRKLRELRGFTQTDLAKLAGISPTTLNKLERRGEKFDQDTLVKIATSLGTTPAAIYGTYAQFQKGVRQEILKKMGTDDPSGMKPGSEAADTPEAPGHETVTDPAGGVMGIDLSNPAYREALAAFERLTPEQQEQAIDYMRDLRRGVHHRQPGKRRA